MIDDQSNQSLATPLICDFFKNNCTQESTYLLSTCFGQTRRTGRKMKNVSIESYDGSHSFRLPDVLECDKIPDVRNEIPTPDVASHYPHLRDIETFIPPLNPDAQIMLLIGVYDPLGFLAPVLIKRKLELRELIGGNVDWDEALP